MANNINNILPPIPVPNFEPAQLLHSVQMYWCTIGGTLTDVLNRLGTNLNQDFVLNVIHAIGTAYTTAELYHPVLLNRNDEVADHNYRNSENMFYDQLAELLNNNNHFANELRNQVREELPLGVRYFVHFLYVLGIEQR